MFNLHRFGKAVHTCLSVIDTYPSESDKPLDKSAFRCYNPSHKGKRVDEEKAYQSPGSRELAGGASQWWGMRILASERPG